MKRLLFIMLILSVLGGATLRAQNLAQMVKEQIERRVNLPAVVGLPDVGWLKSLDLDKVTIQLAFKSNGRTIPTSITLQGSYLDPIKNDS